MSADDRATSELLARYVNAWETDDIDGLVALLKEDATMSMPPSPSWLWGREAIRTFLACTALGFEVGSHWHLSATGANAQPAFVVYRADDHGCYRAFGLQVLTLEDAAVTRRIAEVTTFTLPSLVTSFGFPLELPRLC